MTPAQRTTLEARLPGRVERGAGRLLWGRARYDTYVERLAADLAAGVAEHLTVTATGLAAGAPPLDSGPVLLVDTGTGKLVLLAGSWLHDPHVVAYPDDSDVDPDRSWFRSFHLVRAPATGIVLELVPDGDDTLDASATVPTGALGALPPSLIVVGSLDDLSGVLSRIRQISEE